MNCGLCCEILMGPRGRVSAMSHSFPAFAFLEEVAVVSVRLFPLLPLKAIRSRVLHFGRLIHIQG